MLCVLLGINYCAFSYVFSRRFLIFPLFLCSFYFELLWPSDLRGKQIYIYEVESRAGYPKNTDPTAFWGFCIYILLLNVKQLLRIV